MIALITPYSKPTTTHRSISASISRPSIFLASGSHCLSLDITSSNNNNMSPFLDHYIVATFFAFLFGFLLLFVLRLNNNKNNNMSPFLDHYIVATFFASLFGFLLLFVLRRNNNKKLSNIVQSSFNTGNSSPANQEASAIQEASATDTTASTNTSTSTSTTTTTITTTENQEITKNSRLG
ncbi:hypothetical protein ACOSP7_023366 [Xanthoceras sorbifolium]